MKRNEILEVAVRAYLTDPVPANYAMTPDAIVAFAEIIAAKEREACAALCDAIRPTGGRAWTAEQAACFDALSHASELILARDKDYAQ